jgi:DNA-binding IscR family transcriptional regulator
MTEARAPPGEGNAGPAASLGAIADAAWLAADQAAVEALRAVTLEDLVRRAVAAGLRRPTLEPVSYAI